MSDHQTRQEHVCVTKWKHWLSHLRINLTETLERRDFQRLLRERIKTHKVRPENMEYVWWLWLTNSESLLLGLRRLSDRDDRAISLRNLIKDVEENWSLLSRERYLELLKSQYFPNVPLEMIERANREYDSWKGPNNPNFIDSASVNADLIKLWDAVEAANKLVNQAIAHYQDPNTRAAIPLNVEELLGSVEVAWSLLRKYNVMIEGFDPSTWYKNRSWMAKTVSSLFEDKPLSVSE